jgi:Helix-turn-helix domain
MAEKAKTLLRKLRFFEALSRRRDLSGLQWRITIMLTSLCGTEKGYAYPPFEMMAKNLGATERGVRKAVDELERKGIFTISRGGGAGNANRYWPRFDLVPEGNIYDLENRNWRSCFGTPSKTPPEGLQETNETRNARTETGTGVPQKGNGRSEKTGTDGATNRAIYPGNLSGESCNRSSSEGTPDGAPACPLSLNEAQAIIRRAQEHVSDGLLSRTPDEDLEALANKLREASAHFEYAASDFDSSDGRRFQQCEALIGDVLYELEDRN